MVQKTLKPTPPNPKQLRRDSVVKQISLELYYQLQKEDSVENQGEVDPQEIRDILKKKFKFIAKQSFNKLYDMLNKTLLRDLKLEKDVVITCCTCLTLQNYTGGQVLHKKRSVVASYFVVLTGAVTIVDSKSQVVKNMQPLDNFDRKYVKEQGDYYTSLYTVTASADASLAMIRIEDFEKNIQERG